MTSWVQGVQALIWVSQSVHENKICGGYICKTICAEPPRAGVLLCQPAVLDAYCTGVQSVTMSGAYYPGNAQAS